MAQTLRQRWASLGPRGFVRWALQKRAGKGLVRRLDEVMAAHSRVGDPPVFEARDFPWIAEIERAAPLIRKELDQLLETRKELPAIGEIQPDQGKISGDGWKTFAFHGLGYSSARNCARCPETARALEGVPRLASAWFSILAPGAHIPRHAGITKGWIRCHLGLVVPRSDRRCEMQVADRFVRWEEGRVTIFDDSCKHEVWNETDEERVVLIFDFERPMDRIGRAALAIVRATLSLSPYVRDARRNQIEWEERVYGKGSAVATQPAAR